MIRKLACLLLALLLAGAAGAEETVVIPPDVTEIEDEAFRGAESLTKVVLPEGVTVIGENAFRDSGLLSINLPASLTAIGDNAFRGCPAELVAQVESGSYAHDWCLANGVNCATPEPAGEMQAYINQEWLNRVGCVTPATVDELMTLLNGVPQWDPNGNGTKDEVGIAGASVNDFYVAFQALEPAFEKEKVMLMLAAGEVESWLETAEPFAANALVVIADALPAEYAAEYVLLGQ